MRLSPICHSVRLQLGSPLVDPTIPLISPVLSFFLALSPPSSSPKIGLRSAGRPMHLEGPLPARHYNPDSYAGICNTPRQQFSYPESPYRTYHVDPCTASKPPSNRSGRRRHRRRTRRFEPSTCPHLNATFDFATRESTHWLETDADLFGLVAVRS